MVVIIMGTTGSGKTTVGSLLASTLRWTFADADDFHSAANIAKMHAGIGLTDEDRASWLEAMSTAIAAWIERGSNAVLACSALKRAYRDQLRVDPLVTFVYLKGRYDEIRRRLERRHGHFAGVALLSSQFETLEEPAEDEHVLVVPINKQPTEQVDVIIQALGLTPQP